MNRSISRAMFAGSGPSEWLKAEARPCVYQPRNPQPLSENIIGRTIVPATV